METPVEVELKFPLHNHEALIERLQSIATRERQGDAQKDIYFNPAHKDFLSEKPISEWLRLRESGKSSSINYKRWHTEEGKEAVSCDELETNIGDIEALKHIFERLDFTELVTVEKNRRIYNYKDTEIAIDSITGLGEFIELEAKGNFSDIEEAKQHLYTVLSEIGAEVGEQEFKGYPHLLLEQKGLL